MAATHTQKAVESLGWIRNRSRVEAIVETKREAEKGDQNGTGDRISSLVRKANIC